MQWGLGSVNLTDPVVTWRCALLSSASNVVVKIPH
jgi:hypothetical protein